MRQRRSIPGSLGKRRYLDSSGSGPEKPSLFPRPIRWGRAFRPWPALFPKKGGLGPAAGFRCMVSSGGPRLLAYSMYAFTVGRPRPVRPYRTITLSLKSIVIHHRQCKGGKRGQAATATGQNPPPAIGRQSAEPTAAGAAEWFLPVFYTGPSHCHRPGSRFFPAGAPGRPAPGPRPRGRGSS